MRAKTKFGFTIVELLVVITIIGLLMALLLPAVGRVRNNARRVQCINQQRQLGTAAMNYVSKKENFPGYINEMPTRGLQTRLVSWFTQLLPFADQNGLYDALQVGVDQANNQFDSTTYLDLAVCPSDPPAEKLGTQLSYAINMGVWDGSDSDVKASLANGSAWRDEKANGIAHNLAGLLGRYPGMNQSKAGELKRQAMQLRVSPGYVSSNDGSSTTILLTENVDAGTWFGDNSQDFGHARYQGHVGVAWMDPPTQQLKINEQAGTLLDLNPNDVRYARPSSEHDGVVIVTFADGHTDVVNEDIDMNVYARLLTPNGAESKPRLNFVTPQGYYQKVAITGTDLAN